MHRHRVATRKIFFPSRRGGSVDNNDAITPIGVEDDSWTPPRPRQWRLGKAFIEDEFYNNNCTEDYLFIATQALWQTPLVAVTDDEVLITQQSIGFEDYATDYWSISPKATARTRPFNAIFDDETFAPQAVIETVSSLLGGSKPKKKIRGPYTDPRIYEEYIERCIAERNVPRENVEVAILKEALVEQVSQRRTEAEDVQYATLVSENQILARLVETETARLNLQALRARQGQIAKQLADIEEEEIRQLLMVWEEM